MHITGIICEYNPLHLGHQKQLRLVKDARPDSGIVCLMSGNYVQRGEPAIFDKSLRAEAAVRCGADLVLELPITAALSSAEGFAAKGVEILGGFCSTLSFGAEHPDEDKLQATAAALLSPEFSAALHSALETGISFPAARQKALEALGEDSTLLNTPNDILAVEYCKAMLTQNCPMKPAPILRQGDYHADTPDKENPSATFLRQQIVNSGDWLSYIPEATLPCLQNAAAHTLQNGQRAILGKLRTMTDSEFEALPYGSEGLWRKLMHAARQCASLDALFDAVKSKRYTRTRLNRMVMCAYLGITKEVLTAPVPYVRVLALNDRGREILKTARGYGSFRNAGERTELPYQALENRCGDLFGLFSQTPESPGTEERRRVVYVK